GGSRRLIGNLQIDFRKIAFRTNTSWRESTVKQSLEKMLGLALGFAMLRAQAYKSTDDGGEFFLERKRRNNKLHFSESSGSKMRNIRGFCAYLSKFALS